MKRILARRSKATSSKHREGSELSVVEDGPTEKGAFGLKVLVEGVDPSIE